jgi:hypothetical protein
MLHRQQHQQGTEGVSVDIAYIRLTSTSTYNKLPLLFVLLS